MVEVVETFQLSLIIKVIFRITTDYYKGNYFENLVEVNLIFSDLLQIEECLKFPDILTDNEVSYFNRLYLIQPFGWPKSHAILKYFIAALRSLLFCAFKAKL